MEDTFAPDLSIVVPTRGESESVPLLIKRVVGHLADTELRWELLFVDDSDDDTPDVIERYTQRHPIRLLHRRPGERSGGLSGALNAGLRSARADVCVVMDADLQHPPELLEQLTRPVIAGECDVAIASRYVPGGSALGLDGPFRHFVSRASGRVAKSLFPRVRPVQDPGSGFFALRRGVIDGVELRPEGFKMLVEILVRGRWETFREVPYDFGGRMYGASNVRLALGIKFLVHMSRLWRDVHFPTVRSATPPPERAKTFGKLAPAKAPPPQVRRILVIASELSPTVSGVSHTVGRLSEELAGRGVVIDSLTSADARSVRRGEIRLTSLGLKVAGLHDLRTHYDLISLHGPAPGISDLVLMARRRHPDRFPPLVYTHHFTVELEGWAVMNRTYDHIHRRLARWADHVIVTTPSYLRMLSGGSLGIGRPITMIPWGVDQERFAGVEHDDYDLHRPLRVLFVGQQRAYKGVPLLIRAVAGIDELELDIIGNGPLEAVHRHLAANLRATNVRFQGRATEAELVAAFAGHDVIALPSVNRLEAFGLVLLEGMSAGCVPVASDVPGVCDVATSTGVLVPPGDSHALRDALVDLAHDPDRVHDMRKRSRELGSRYSWTSTVEDYLKVFNSVVANTSATARRAL